MINESTEQLVQALNKQHAEGKLLKQKDLLFILKEEINNMMENNISKKTQLEVLKRKYPEIQYLLNMSDRSYARLCQKYKKTFNTQEEKARKTEIASQDKTYAFSDAIKKENKKPNTEEKKIPKITKEEFNIKMDALLRKKEKSPVSIEQAFSLDMSKLEEIEKEHKKNVEEEIETLRREYENYSH